MQKRQWLHTALCLGLIRALVLSAYAQDAMIAPMAAKSAGTRVVSGSRHTGPGRSGFGFQGRIEKAVGLTPEQRETVRGLLAQQHEALRALREGMEPKYQAIQQDTDAKIRALLNSDQQKKFDAFLAQQKQGRAARQRRAS